MPVFQCHPRAIVCPVLVHLTSKKELKKGVFPVLSVFPVCLSVLFVWPFVCLYITSIFQDWLHRFF